MLIALIPFCVGITTEDNYAVKTVSNYISKSANDTTTTETYENIELTENELDAICCSAMEYIKEDTDIQTKLAVLSLCTNNYIFEKKENTANNDMQISSYSDDLLEELRQIMSKGLVEFVYEGKTVYIPFIKRSSGYTVTSDEYPYIQEIASPWDRTANENHTECGISVAGIEYLCNNSSTAEDALRWYLPNFEIKYVEFIQR